MLTLAFIACTVIGTLTHEIGHYLVAKGFGLSSSIHYAYVPFSPEIDDIADPAQRAWTRLAIRIGGPLQTILTGCLGLVLLRRSTAKRPIDDMPSTEQWVYIFLSLFWLRQLASFAVIAVQFFLLDHVSVRGDEAQIALSLGLPSQLFNVITGCMGALVVWYIIFRHVPSSLRLTFMAAGLVGGGIGYYLWLERIGPIMLP